MILDEKRMCPGRTCLRRCVLCELAEARRPRNDFAHLIRSDFVAAEPEKFTRHALNLFHAQTQRHQLVPTPSRSDHPRENRIALDAAIAASAPGIGRSGPNLVGGPSYGETQRFRRSFSDSAIDASLGGKPPYQFVHIAPSPTGLTGSSACQIDLERLRSEIQAIRMCDGLDRVASVAAMQE